MAGERLDIKPNQQSAAPVMDFGLLSVGAINDFRQSQHEKITNAGQQSAMHLDPGVSSEQKLQAKADAETLAEYEIDQDCFGYVSQIVDPAADPILHAKLSSELQKVTVSRMDDRTWTSGTTRGKVEGATTGSGVGDPESSGQRQFETAVSQIHKEVHQAELDNMPMEALRSKLASLSLQRRQLISKSSPKAKNLREEYGQYEAIYKMRIARGIARTILQSTQDSLTKKEVHTNTVNHVLQEHKEFTEAELAAKESDTSRRMKVATWLAKPKHLLGFGFASGLAGSWFIKGLTGAVVGVGAPVALVGAAAMRTTKAIATSTITNKVHLIRTLEQRSHADREELDTKAYAEIMRHSVMPYKPENMDRYANNLGAANAAALTSLLARRIERDRKDNRNRVIKAVSITGGAALAGVLVDLGIHDFIGQNSSGHQIGGSALKSPEHTTSVNSPTQTPSTETSPTPQTQAGTTPSSRPAPSTGNSTPRPNTPPATTPGSSGSTPSTGNGNTQPGAGNSGKPSPNGNKPGTDTNPPGKGDGSGSTKPDVTPPKEFLTTKDGSIIVENGNGYQTELAQLVAEKGVKLTDAQSWRLYLNLHDTVGQKSHGNYFTDDPSYSTSDGYERIANAGKAQWSAEALKQINKWLVDNEEELDETHGLSSLAKSTLKSIAVTH